MDTRRRWNWEAALLPCWGWYRRVPIARGVSLLYPAFVVAWLGIGRVLSAPDLVVAYLAVGAGYGLVYGLTGDWMLRQARSKDASAAQQPASLPRLLLHAAPSVVLVAATLPLVIAGVGQSHEPERPVGAVLKSDLRNLVGSQEAHFADYGRYAATLDSLAYEASTKVTLSILHADSVSFAAEASHQDAQMRCRISIGPWSGAPADSLEGVPLCDEVRAPR